VECAPRSKNKRQVPRAGRWTGLSGSGGGAGGGWWLWCGEWLIRGTGIVHGQCSAVAKRWQWQAIACTVLQVAGHRPPGTQALGAERRPRRSRFLSLCFVVCVCVFGCLIFWVWPAMAGGGGGAFWLWLYVLYY
jgi:hypothetical protein